MKDAAWPKSDFDRFLLAALEAKNLTPVADADPATLLRRVTLDLTGLQPTPAEIEAFLADHSPEAYAKVVDRLPEGPRYYPEGQVTDLTERFIASELIREQVLSYLHQEVPHAIAVVIEEFKERQPGRLYLSATIYVEKDSQKRIVVGAKGSMLKQIGVSARKEIEQVFKAKVYLDLWVKVRPRWRRDDIALRHVGYPL